MKKFKLSIIALSSLLFVACSGSDSDSGGTTTEEKVDPCEEMTVSDFSGFLDVFEDTPESEFKNILPGVAHGSYSDDKSSFTYIFDDLEDISTYVTVNAESGKVAYFNILLNTHDKSDLKKTHQRMLDNYTVEDCHDQFFMMSQKDIEKIMGKDNLTTDLDSGDYWLEYDDGDMAVDFYFPTNNKLGCIMIRVTYAL